MKVTEAELRTWGERLGESLRPGAVVAVRGDLGAGKTTLAQAICRGYGVTDEVTSPTFAIVHEYRAPASPVYHVDLYRLEGAKDLQNIGWDDMVRAAALLIVEWPERAGDAMPPDHVSIQLEHDRMDPAKRRLRLSQPQPAAR